MAVPEPDPYAVLNVARAATEGEIRAAYQALVRKYHPDLHQGNPLQELASARLAEVNRAYETLSDPGRRAAHDAGAGGPVARPDADPRTGRRLVRGAAFLLLLPFALRLLVRVAPAAIRAIGGLFRVLFEATASLRGGRIAGAAVIALAILVVVLFRRGRPRRGGRPR